MKIFTYIYFRESEIKDAETQSAINKAAEPFDYEFFADTEINLIRGWSEEFQADALRDVLNKAGINYTEPESLLEINPDA